MSSGGTLVTEHSVLGTGLWLAHATTLGRVQVCVRAENASGSGGGGILTIDAGSVVGAVPQVGVSGDLTPCTVLINHLDQPVKLWLDASPPGSNPQSVCVDAGVVRQRVYVQTGSGGSPVSFTPDG